MEDENSEEYQEEEYPQYRESPHRGNIQIEEKKSGCDIQPYVPLIICIPAGLLAIFLVLYPFQFHWIEGQFNNQTVTWASPSQICTYHNNTCLIQAWPETSHIPLVWTMFLSAVLSYLIGIIFVIVQFIRRRYLHGIKYHFRILILLATMGAILEFIGALFWYYSCIKEFKELNQAHLTYNLNNIWIYHGFSIWIGLNPIIIFMLGGCQKKSRADDEYCDV